jgi:predicted nucleic acid-binding protein
VKHVFVETNWVVDCAAPEHHRAPAALALLERAADAEILLHLPAICLTEARSTILRRFQPRSEADAIRKFLSWVKPSSKVTPAEDTAARRVVDMFEAKVKADLRELGTALDALARRPGVETFPLSERMLERAVALATSELAMEPFDQAILAGVLVRAQELREAGATDLVFCERDSDLQPWDRSGNAKQPLTDLYDQARLWVYRDFELSGPEPPPGWPEA